MHAPQDLRGKVARRPNASHCIAPPRVVAGALASFATVKPGKMEEVRFDCDVDMSHLGRMLKLRDDITSEKWQGI